MRVTTLSVYNYQEVFVSLPDFRQLLPFYRQQKLAREAFLEELKLPNKTCVAIEKHNRLIMYATFENVEETAVVTNFLLRDDQLAPKQGGAYWLNVLEKMIRYEGSNQIATTFLGMDHWIVSLLEADGYQLQSETSGHMTWLKRLHRHRGLVLGGGGARGAYQIGVWQALKELDISYDSIAGTSVGALNGALIAQGDYEAARRMWHEIDTGKILTYDGLALSNDYTFKKTIKDVQNFVVSAISHQGVSTAPLREMIANFLNLKIIYQQPKELFLCTTALPSLKERVISLKETPPEEFGQWLLASASFFPAMEAAKIEGVYYVDGGYRNNVPIDVVLEAGATEAIVVDVKGPGMTKPHHLPGTFPVRRLTSRWNLGTVLLFDGARSDVNMALGYLETLKSYGRYIGGWYTFDHQFLDEEVCQWQTEFTEEVLKGQTGTRFKGVSEKEINELLLSIRSLYSDRLTEKNLGIYLLEYVAKQLGITPVVVYRLPDMIEEIQRKINQGWLEETFSDGVMLSLNEWIARLVSETVPLSEKQQLASMCYLLKKDEVAEQVTFSWPVPTKVYLAARLINYLEGRNQSDEPRV